MAFTSVATWQAGLENSAGLFDETIRSRTAPASLEECYHDQAWSTVFWYFCQSEYNTENLAFLIAVDQFAQSGDMTLAQQIYDNYVSDAAAQQINLDGTTRAYLDGLLGPGGQGFGPPNLFDDARTVIWNLLRNDTFVRFYNSVVATQTELWGESAGADAWWNDESRERS